jgi:hypothetical protein
MAYFTRVLSKLDTFPSLEELTELVRANHSDFKFVVEEGSEEEWETLLLATEDDVEIALLERQPVYDGSLGQDDIADLREDLEDCKPETGVEWVREFLDEVQTVFAFQHLQGADSDEGSAAVHALRNSLWERGEAIIQADNEGFTNEEGFHIVWQFSDSISGPWNMAVLQEGAWHHFKMDLGDPDHRAAFLRGEVPPDVSSVQLSVSKD